MRTRALLAALLSSVALPAFAGPISSYPAASTPLTGSEEAIGTQSAATVQISTASVAAFAWAGMNSDCSVNTSGNVTCVSSAGNFTVKGNLTVTGHTFSGGSAPACKTNCASVTGTDTRMAIVGNATITSVAVTFATAFASTPICVATGNTTATGALGVVANTTTLTVSMSSSTPTIYASCAD